MFVTKNQFCIFVACLAFGGASGLLLSFEMGLKNIIKPKIFKILIDVFYFFILSLCFLFYTYKLNFPNLRFYMLIGVFVGNYMYFKSFHIMLAKFTKKFYNIIVQKIKRNKGRNNDRRKSKKSNSSHNGGRNITTFYSNFNNGLSNDFNQS